MTRRRFLLISSGCLASAAIYSFIEPNFIEVREVNLSLDLGVKVLHVSDFHLHGWGSREEEIVELINRLQFKTDVTLITGDIYDKYTPNLDLVKDFLSCFKGAISVLGNHEHWASGKYPLNKGLKVLEDEGVKTLLNEKIVVKGVEIGGIDWYEDETSMGMENLSRVGEVDVLLSHTPDVIELNPRAKITLAGHTHGGQVCIPFIGPLWTPSKYGVKYASGLFNQGGRYLYVNRGLGESPLLPVRFNCKREVTILNL